jgi:hypothetical protein
VLEIKRQPTPEDFAWQIFAAFTAQGTGVDDPAGGHGFDGRSNVFAASFAPYYEVMEAFWRAVKHENSIANKRRKHGGNLKLKSD